MIKQAAETAVVSVHQPGRLNEIRVPGATLNKAGLDEASLDELTGIANRRYFERVLPERLASGSNWERAVTLLLLDLDRFKAVNDGLGHAAGDILLRRVAERIQSQLGGGDLFARLGGDEFAILVEDGGAVGELALRIVDLVQRTYLIEGSPVNIGVSIGVAFHLKDAQNPQHLMRCADLALYQAKAAGRNCFILFEPHMEVRAKAKRAMEMDLRKALALRQLEMHYRSHLDTSTLQLLGLEAVLQWRHPVHGMLAADQFMPLAEETGLSMAIGEWAIKAVCREAARWPEEVGVALRLSPFQFESNRFLEAVKQALATFGLAGSRLELEITGGILLRDSNTVTTMLEQLRACGVKIAVDRFGTGLASLSQMVEFPMDKIKIATSLVQQQGTGMKERALVRAIAALGASLGVRTIVEGVSTQEHLCQIRQDGCSLVQGCLVSDPVPAASLQGLLNGLSSQPVQPAEAYP